RPRTAAASMRKTLFDAPRRENGPLQPLSSALISRTIIVLFHEWCFFGTIQSDAENSVYPFAQRRNRGAVPAFFRRVEVVRAEMNARAEKFGHGAAIDLGRDQDIVCKRDPLPQTRGFDRKMRVPQASAAQRRHGMQTGELKPMRPLLG